MSLRPSPRLGDRSHFPDLAPRVYANHAGIAPPSLAVREAVAGVLADYARRGAGAYMSWSEQRTRLRGKLAALVGAEAKDLAFIPNTTSGVIDIALCFPWERGDRVIVFEGEFPANVTPWQSAARQHGLEVVMLPLTGFQRSDAEGLAALEGALARGARMVAVSAVEFQTGLRMPLGPMAALCHRYGAQLFVDGIQALGVAPIDVGALQIDYLASGSHKWLMGTEGAGFLYVSPARVDALVPRMAGWLSHEEGVRFLFEGRGWLRYDRPIVQRAGELFEGGNCNAMGFAALEASLDILVGLGVESIRAHVHAWHDALEPGLVERGFTSLRASLPARRSGTLSLYPPEGVSVVAVHDSLERQGVATATPDGALRFSPHWPNSLDEIPAVLGAIDAALAEERAG